MEVSILGIGDKLPAFSITGVKPKFMEHREGGASAVETIANESFLGKGKGHLFLPRRPHLRLPYRDRGTRAPHEGLWGS